MPSQPPVYIHYTLTAGEAHAVRVRLEAQRAHGCTDSARAMQRAWVMDEREVDASASMDACVERAPRPLVVADAGSSRRLVSGCLVLPAADAQVITERAHRVGMSTSEYVRRMLLGLPV